MFATDASPGVSRFSHLVLPPNENTRTGRKEWTRSRAVCRSIEIGIGSFQIRVAISIYMEGFRCIPRVPTRRRKRTTSYLPRWNACIRPTEPAAFQLSRSYLAQLNYNHSGRVPTPERRGTVWNILLKANVLALKNYSRILWTTWGFSCTRRRQDTKVNSPSAKNVLLQKRFFIAEVR